MSVVQRVISTLVFFNKQKISLIHKGNAFGDKFFKKVKNNKLNYVLILFLFLEGKNTKKNNFR